MGEVTNSVLVIRRERGSKRSPSGRVSVVAFLIYIKLRHTLFLQPPQRIFRKQFLMFDFSWGEKSEHLFGKRLS